MFGVCMSCVGQYFFLITVLLLVHRQRLSGDRWLSLVTWEKPLTYRCRDVGFGCRCLYVCRPIVFYICIYTFHIFFHAASLSSDYSVTPVHLLPVVWHVDLCMASLGCYLLSVSISSLPFLHYNSVFRQVGHWLTSWPRMYIFHIIYISSAYVHLSLF